MRLLFFFLNFLICIDVIQARTDLNLNELERVKKVIKPTSNFMKAERSEALTGGAGTVSNVGKNAYSHHFTTLSFEERQNFLIGNGFFRKLWIAAPSSTISSDGLAQYTMQELVNLVILKMEEAIFQLLKNLYL